MDKNAIFHTLNHRQVFGHKGLVKLLAIEHGHVGALRHMDTNQVLEQFLGDNSSGRTLLFQLYKEKLIQDFFDATVSDSGFITDSKTILEKCSPQLLQKIDTFKKEFNDESEEIDRINNRGNIDKNFRCKCKMVTRESLVEEAVSCLQNYCACEQRVADAVAVLLGKDIQNSGISGKWENDGVIVSGVTFQEIQELKWIGNVNKTPLSPDTLDDRTSFKIRSDRLEGLFLAAARHRIISQSSSVETATSYLWHD